jgi:hypothetical protein
MSGARQRLSGSTVAAVALIDGVLKQGARNNAGVPLLQQGARNM